MQCPGHDALQEELIEVLLVAPDQHHGSKGVGQPLGGGPAIGRVGALDDWPGAATATCVAVTSGEADAARVSALPAPAAKFVEPLVGRVGQPRDEIARRLFAAGRRDDAAKIPAAERFDLDGRLVGLDGKERRARAHERPFGGVPLDDCHVAAGRTEMRDDDRMFHLTAFPALPKSRISRCTSACMARRPATITSARRPEPIAS